MATAGTSSFILAWIAASASAGPCRHPGPACRGLDRAADAALPQSAARPDRGADLRPRMAARLRQAAAAAMVAGGDRIPDRSAMTSPITCWRRWRWWRLLPSIFAMARPLVGPLGALLAVLIVDGLHYLNYTAAKFNHDVIQLPFWALAGLRLPPRFARRRAAALAAARAGGRPVAVGEIFRAGAGGAAGAVRSHRPRRAQVLGDAGTLCRGRRRADRDGAASGLAGAERLSAVRLCRTPRAAVARADRSYLAPAAIRRSANCSSSSRRC